MPKVSFETLVEQSRAALRDGTFAAEEKAIREAIRGEPGNFDLNFGLGVMLAEAGRFQESVFFLARATDLSQDEAPLWHLARSQRRAQDHGGLVETLKRLAAFQPKNLELLRELAKMQFVSGDDADARVTLQQAQQIDPRNPDIALRLADIAETPEEQLRLIEAYVDLVRDAPELVSHGLQRLAYMTNRFARQNAGLSPHHAASWRDLCSRLDHGTLNRYRAALEYELASGPARREAIIDRASIAIVQDDWQLAEQLFKALRKEGARHIGSIATFDLDTWGKVEALGYTDIFRALPAVTWLSRDGRADPTLFLASDPRYYERFTVPFLLALRGTNSQVPVHVHIMGGTEDEWTTLRDIGVRTLGRRLTFTAEACAETIANYEMAAREYYHAVRFVRLYHLVILQSRTGWLLDVDGTVTVDPSATLAELGERDAAFACQAKELTPWNKINANIVGISPTPLGSLFARLVSAFIVKRIAERKLIWYADQLALFSSYAYLVRTNRQPETWFLGPEVVSFNNQEKSVFAFVVGLAKYEML